MPGFAATGAGSLALWEAVAGIVGGAPEQVREVYDIRPPVVPENPIRLDLRGEAELEQYYVISMT